ncbi:MAG: protein kinase [Pseudomonadota bacterium]
MSEAVSLSSDGEFLPIGTILYGGRYTVTEHIGASTTELTYHAKAMDGRQVVVRELFTASICYRDDRNIVVRLPSDGREFKKLVNRFVLHGQQFSEIEHENLARIIDTFAENGSAYAVREYTPGVLLQDAGYCVPEELVEIAELLLEGLEYLHSKGMLHRDISPITIHINDARDPVILDWDVLKDAEARAVSRNLSRPMNSVRTGYSPPEFYGNALEYAPSSDLYSLAATLYMVIAGTPPVDAGRRMAKVAQGDEDPLEPIWMRAADDYPRPFLAALQQALEIQPEKRPQSAAEMRELFEADVDEALFSAPLAKVPSEPGDAVGNENLEAESALPSEDLVTEFEMELAEDRDPPIAPSMDFVEDEEPTSEEESSFEDNVSDEDPAPMQVPEDFTVVADVEKAAEAEPQQSTKPYGGLLIGAVAAGAVAAGAAFYLFGSSGPSVEPGATDGAAAGAVGVGAADVATGPAIAPEASIEAEAIAPPSAEAAAVSGTGVADNATRLDEEAPQAVAAPGAPDPAPLAIQDVPPAAEIMLSLEESFGIVEDELNSAAEATLPVFPSTEQAPALERGNASPVAEPTANDLPPVLDGDGFGFEAGADAETMEAAAPAERAGLKGATKEVDTPEVASIEQAAEMGGWSIVLNLPIERRGDAVVFTEGPDSPYPAGAVLSAVGGTPVGANSMDVAALAAAYFAEANPDTPLLPVSVGNPTLDAEEDADLTINVSRTHSFAPFEVTQSQNDGRWIVEITNADASSAFEVGDVVLSEQQTRQDIGSLSELNAVLSEFRNQVPPIAVFVVLRDGSNETVDVEVGSLGELLE